MWYLKPKDAGSVHYLIGRDMFKIGRLHADIKISQISVSRNHAAIFLKNNKCILTDLGSLAGTFVDGKKIEKNDKIRLKENNNISFGSPETTYTLQKVDISVICIKLPDEQKEQLLNNIQFLEGDLHSKWNKSSTYITLRKIKLSETVLSALIANQKMVTIQYWADCVDCVREKKPLPDHKLYSPELDEVMISKSLKIEESLDRTHLFQGKVFVFLTEMSKQEMGKLVSMAGGRALSWENERPSAEDMSHEIHQYLFITENRKNLDKNCEIIESFDKIIAEMKINGKRAIPKTEIIYAILYCSCEKHCNPLFHHKSLLIPKDPSSQSSSEIILATETQSDVFSGQNTLQQSSSSSCNVETRSDLGESEPASLKRPIQIYDDEKVVKKPKDDTASTHYKASTSSFGMFPPEKNPFMLNRYLVTHVPSSKSKTIASKPAEKKRKSDTEIDESMNRPTKKPFTNISNTVESNKPANKPEIDFEASVINRSGGWISRIFDELNLKEDTKTPEPQDEETTKWIRSFKTVKVDKKQLFVKKVPQSSVNLDVTDSNTTKNFKKFCKVQPRCIQNIIIPISNLNATVKSISIPVEERKSGSEDEETPPKEAAVPSVYQFQLRIHEPRPFSKFFQKT